MPIPPLNLDDRKFSDLVDEIRGLIPRCAPMWTDHNVSDPGIMLIELFAWLGEAQLYRLNRISEASRVRLLELLGAIFQPARPAILKSTVTADCLEQPWTLTRGARIEARPNPERAVIIFETLDDVVLTPAAPQCMVLARQTESVEEEMLGVSNGRPYQLFELAERFITLPKEPFPRPPKVWVGGELWEYRATLSTSQPTDKHFTVRPWLNVIAFGDGVHGHVPGQDTKIVASYRFAPTAQGSVQREQLGSSNGRPAQVFRLSKPILALDLQESAELGPNVWVDGQRWEYHSNFMDMVENGAEYTVEPRRNGIRFGDGQHGQIPPKGAKIRIGRAKPRTVGYYYTSGAEGNLPIRTTFSVKQDADGPKLSVGSKYEIVACGSNPTELDEARDQVTAILEPCWRAITATDIETIVTRNHADIARAHCLSRYDLTAPGEQSHRPGHVGVIVVPQPTHQWTASTADMHQVVGFTPNGQRLVARGGDGTVRLWDMKCGTQQAILESALRDVAISPDGHHIAAAGDDQVVRIWDTRTMQAQSLHHPAPVTAVAFRFDGKILATACADNGVRLWDMAGNVVVAAYQHAAAVNDVIFSTDGQRVASAGDDGLAILWDWEHRAQEEVLAHVAPVNAVAFHPNAKDLATGGADGIVLLWDTQKASKTSSLPHAAPVLDMAYSPTGELLATACSDGTAHLWDMRNGVQIALFYHASSINALAFSPDGQRLVTASEDQTVMIWDVLHRRKILSIPHESSVHAVAVAVTHDGLTLVTAGNDQVVRRWKDISAMQHPRRMDDYLAASVMDCIFSPDGRRLTTITSDDSASLWDTESGARIALLSADRLIRKAAFSADGQLLATASAPFIVTNGVLLCTDASAPAPSRLVRTHVHLWDAIQGAPLVCFPHDSQVVDIVFRPDCQQLATIDVDDRIRLWDTRLWQPAPGFAAWIQGQDAIFSPDGARLLTRTRNNEATLWSTRTGKSIASFVRHTAIPHAVFSPDGRWLATAHPDMKVRCWNARDGSPAQEFTVETEVEDLVFCPNSQRLVTIGLDVNTDYVIQLWDMRLLHDEAIRTVAVKDAKSLVVNASGQWLALIGERLLRIWDAETGVEISTLYIDLVGSSAAGKVLFLPIGGDDQPDPRNGNRHTARLTHRLPLQLTLGKFLVAVGDNDTDPPTRTVQLWNAEHVYDVDEFLTGRRLVTTRQHVRGPAYKDISVRTTVTRSTPTTGEQQLFEEVNRALVQFFHPLSGGPEGKGWPPGRAVYRSEVYQVIEGVAGVDHVESLVFDPQDVENCVQIAPYHLVNCSVQTEVSQ